MAQDPEGYEERFDELAQLAYRVGFRLLGEREEAQDVAQEAMARAFARWRHVERYADAWVTRVATNLALGALRRRPKPTVGGPSATPDGAELLAEREHLAAALRRLPRRQREVIALRYLADFSEAQVADALGCSVGTVKSHAHRGLAGLRAHLGTRLDFAGGTA